MKRKFGSLMNLRSVTRVAVTAVFLIVTIVAPFSVWEASAGGGHHKKKKPASTASVVTEDSDHKAKKESGNLKKTGSSHGQEKVQKGTHMESMGTHK